MKKKLAVALSVLSIGLTGFASSSSAQEITSVIAPNSAKYASYFIGLTENIKEFLNHTGDVVRNNTPQGSRSTIVEGQNYFQIILSQLSHTIPPEGYEQAHYHLFESVMYNKASMDATLAFIDGGDQQNLDYAKYDLQKAGEYAQKYNDDLKAYVSQNQ